MGEENIEMEKEKVYTEKEVEKIKRKILVPFFILFVFLVITYIVGGFLVYNVFKDVAGDINIKKFLNVVQLYDKYYTEDINIEKAIDYSITGFVASTEDKYGGYIPRKNSVTTGEKIMKGKYQGLGITYSTEYIEDGYLEIIDIVEDSEASRSDLKIGDIIIEINDKKITEEVVEKFRENMRNQELDEVIFTLRNNEKIRVPIGIVNFPKIEFEIEEDVGYINIHTFVLDTVPLFKEALIRIQEENVSEIVFDLRDNGGGDVEAVTKMLDMMVKEGLIVDLEYNTGKKEEIYATTECYLKDNIKIIILVNKNTASASELFTMCSQDLLNAYVVGEQTYGKSTILSYFNFKDGSILVMSSGIYYPQSGRNIEDDGITPDKILSDKELVLSSKEIYKLL